MSFVEVISNSTVWWEAAAVYKSTTINVQLTETTGGGLTTGTIAAGAYTKTTFSTALQSLLNTISANDYTYTVTIDQVNYVAMPNSGTPNKWGSSFSVEFNGVGNFVLSFS